MKSKLRILKFEEKINKSVDANAISALYFKNLGTACSEENRKNSTQY